MSATDEIVYRKIGIIRTPYKERAPYQPVENAEESFFIELDPKFTDALEGLEHFNYICIFYHLNREKDGNYKKKVIPPWMRNKKAVGLFASRSPARPNPLGFAVVRLKKIEGNRIYISGIDAFDMTPVIDVKPYIGMLDSKPDANNGWITGEPGAHEHLMMHLHGIPHGHSHYSEHSSDTSDTSLEVNFNSDGHTVEVPVFGRKYPFTMYYEHITPIKPYAKPHPIIINLDRFLFGKFYRPDRNPVIITDKPSYAHACEIYTAIALTKQIIPKAEVFTEPSTEMRDTIETYLDNGLSVIVTSINDGVLPDNILPVDIGNRDYSVYTPLVGGDSPPENILLFVKNGGKCYVDTADAVNDLLTFLRPRRKKSISMYPYGIMHICDMLGEKITESLPISIKFVNGDISGNFPVNVYINGPESVGTKNGKVISALDTTVKVKPFKPTPPYLAVFTLNGYAPPEVAAVGIANGRNCILLKIIAEYDKPMDTLIEIGLPQNIRPIMLAGMQRERTLEPTELIKHDDGTLTLSIKLTPGRPVHKFVRNSKLNPKLRDLQYILGKFPRFEFIYRK